jgi:hypothetical protein
VHKMTAEIHLICEMLAKVNVYRAECSLSDSDRHILPNTSPCSLLIFCITNPEQIARNVRISNEEPSTRFIQNLSYFNMK